MAVIDGFIFYNELDLLEYRLTLLYPVVDWFIIVEAECTFTRQPKPLFYLENQQRFARYKDKIRHVIVPASEMVDNNPWVNEATQRNAIVRGLDADCRGVLLVSDVDEIPNPLVPFKNLTQTVSLSMDFYYYNLNTRVLTPWTYPKASLLPLQMPPDELRRHDYSPIFDAGWHLSYFGDPTFIQNKIANFSHQEFNVPAFTDLEQIQQRISAASDLFGRADNRLMSISVADNDRLPPRHVELLWRHYSF